VHYYPTIRTFTILKFEKLSFVNQALCSRAEMMGIRDLQHQYQHQNHDVNNHVMLRILSSLYHFNCLVAFIKSYLSLSYVACLKSSDIANIIWDSKNS